MRKHREISDFFARYTELFGGGGLRVRRAVLIIGLLFLVIIWIQSFLFGASGEIIDDHTFVWGGILGRFVAILFGLGAALVMVRPLFSVVILGSAGALAIVVAAFTGFSDLFLWGIMGAVLACISYFAEKEKRDRDKQQGYPL